VRPLIPRTMPGLPATAAKASNKKVTDSRNRMTLTNCHIAVSVPSDPEFNVLASASAMATDRIVDVFQAWAYQLTLANVAARDRATGEAERDGEVNPPA
jgi:hypothetical protein